MKSLMGLLAGLLFGVGLTLGGMTDPVRVQGFLDVTGNWDPTLIFVLGAAVVTTFLGYRFVLRRPSPVFDVSFSLPERTTLDISLLSGAALFGIGWGLSGYCPGPAIASLSVPNLPLGAFILSMGAGWGLVRRLQAA